MNRRTRFLVLKRDHFRCRYCGATEENGHVLHVDHIEPRSKGGEDDTDNYITACDRCNLGKGALRVLPTIKSEPSLKLGPLYIRFNDATVIDAAGVLRGGNPNTGFVAEEFSGPYFSCYAERYALADQLSDPRRFHFFSQYADFRVAFFDAMDRHVDVLHHRWAGEGSRGFQTQNECCERLRQMAEA